MKLQPLAELVVDSLVRRIRILAECQIKQLAIGFEPQSNVRNNLRALLRRDLIAEFQFETKALHVSQPLVSWTPYQTPTPDFGKLAWIAKSRYQNAKTQCHQIFVATEMAERMFGGIGGSLRQPNQLMHDLGTAAIFVAKRIDRSPELAAWTSEDMLRRRYRHLHIQKIPDAAIVADSGITKAIEFAGRDYSRKYLLKFHCYWQSRNTPYEIW
jgi:hypothetical protein